jgi:hypothetical protein
MKTSAVRATRAICTQTVYNVGVRAPVLHHKVVRRFVPDDAMPWNDSSKARSVCNH